MITSRLEIELKRKIFKASYFEFFKWAFTILLPTEKYEDSFHVKLLCDTYQKEIERIIRREEKDKDIIANIPPRATKSLITSVILNAWIWILDPTMTFIGISFDDDLALKNAQDCKDLIKSDEYQELFGDIFQIRSDIDSKSFFQNDKGGFRLSKTTGSNITGHKGVVIVVDDPQNPKTAEQEIERKKVITYYTNALFNRLTPLSLGIRIIIMQRLHEEDLTGYLLKNNPNDYTHICLPAELSSEVKPIECVAEYRDGLLDPRRLSKKLLMILKSVLGTRGYAGQYGQTPAPEDGNIIKKEWFKIVTPQSQTRDPESEPICFIIDGAYTDKTANDPSAILACYKSNVENKLKILDVVEVWLEFPALCRFIVTYVNKFHLTNQSRIFIEPKASGKSVAQQLRSITNLNIIETVAPDTSKVTRAYAITPRLEGGRVDLVEGPYVNNFLTQCVTFPNAAHDDMVDDLIMAVEELIPANNNPDYIFM